MANYSGGYFNTALSATSQYSLTISALEVLASANPATRPAGTPIVATITILVQDKLGQLPPDQTPVLLTTTAGHFPTHTAILSAGTRNGQVTADLSLAATDGVAQVIATVGSVSNVITVTVTPPDDRTRGLRLFLPLVNH